MGVGVVVGAGADGDGEEFASSGKTIGPPSMGDGRGEGSVISPVSALVSVWSVVLGGGSCARNVSSSVTAVW